MKKQNPACLTDRNILRAALADYLLSNKLQQNILLNAYDILEKGSANNEILTNGFFKTHAWLTVKKGQRLEVGGKVHLSACGGLA